MNLIPIETPEDFLLAQHIVLAHEETSVSLASLVRRESSNLIFISSADIPHSVNEILGVIDLDHTIYHCIPDISKVDDKEFSAKITSFIKKPVRCISGELLATDFLIKNMCGNEKIPKTVFPYKMMHYQPSGVFEPVETTPQLSDGDEIIRCTENDIELLHPLQKKYMNEEVAGPDHKITDQEVDIMLRQILKNQLCFALISDGEPAAKANTNAIGFNCVQIGGVFTHPLYRHNGYAAALVTALCQRAIRAHKHPVLFVKEKNTPAFTLYQKLGFTECGRYKIAYF